MIGTEIASCEVGRGLRSGSPNRPERATRACFGLRATFLLLGVIALSACQTPTTRPDSWTANLGAPLAIDDARAGRVLGDYFALAAARPALRGSARVALSGPDFKLNRPQRIVVARPDRLRFEVLGLFDQIAGLLVTDGESFGFFEAASGQVSRGPVTPDLLWQLAKLDLDPAEVVGLLLGAPLPPGEMARAGVWLEPAGRIVVGFGWPAPSTPEACARTRHARALESACFATPAAMEQGGELLFFDSVGRLSEIRSLGSGGALRYRALFEDYREAAEGAAFARRVTVESPVVESEARFLWKQFAIDEQVPENLFQLP